MAKAKRQIKNTTPVTINGEEMFLKYNVFAIRKMNELNVDLTKFNENTPMTIDDIAKILYCGLATYDPSMTLDEVCMLIDIGDMEYLANKIMEAMNIVSLSKNL